MLKKMMIVVLFVGGFLIADAAEAEARILRRIAPVRRVASRAVLTPYRVAPRVMVRPVVVHRPVVYTQPVYTAPVYVSPAPIRYRPRVSIGVGVGYYGW